jgi:hypothetical protein
VRDQIVVDDHVVFILKMGTRGAAALHTQTFQDLQVCSTICLRANYET